MTTNLSFVIPDAAQRRSGIQKQMLSLHLDSGFALYARPGMTTQVGCRHHG